MLLAHVLVFSQNFDKAPSLSVASDRALPALSPVKSAAAPPIPAPIKVPSPGMIAVPIKAPVPTIPALVPAVTYSSLATLLLPALLAFIP